MKTVSIVVDSSNSRQAGMGAQELRDLLILKGLPVDAVEINKERNETQDLGTILTVILTSAAVTTIAQGIKTFIAKRGERVLIRMPNGATIEISGNASDNAGLAKVIRELQSDACC